MEKKKKFLSFLSLYRFNRFFVQRLQEPISIKLFKSQFLYASPSGRVCFEKYFFMNKNKIKNFLYFF